jgi:hypothetical protein
MIIANIVSVPSALRKTALLALGCVFGFLLVPAPAKAADTATLLPLADKSPALPLTATFSKVADAEKGPYVLKLKNDSKETIKVTAKILLSVVFHAESKAKNLPEHAIEAGQVWTIADLAAEDKVILTAAGFAPLELVVK